MKKAAYLLLAVLVVLMLPVTAMAAEAEVAALIGALPSVEEFKAMDEESRLDAYNRTQAAYDAYMALSEEEKANLEGAEETFEALFSHYNTLVAPVEETRQGDRRSAALSMIFVILAANAGAMLLTGVGRKRR